MKKCLLTFLFLWCSLSLMAFPAGKTIQETIKIAAKVSGKVLSPAAQHAAAQALSKAVARYGDDALKVTRSGGLEALKQGRRYGDAFWKVARHADPVAIRSLALHTEELLPIAKRIGPEFLQLEAQVPGVAAKAAALFGDDAVKALSKAPADDISRLVGLAQRAESPAARRLLFKRYASVPDKEKFLKALDWKKIGAIGISTASIVGAYKLGSGVEEGLVTLAKNNPEAFATVLSDGIAPFRWLLFAMLVLVLWPLINFLWKWSKITLFKSKPGQEKDNTSPEPQEKQKTDSTQSPAITGKSYPWLAESKRYI